jgi:hypothetical protein
MCISHVHFHVHFHENAVIKLQTQGNQKLMAFSYTLLAKSAPQGAFVNGGQMCTICASMLAMALASGLFPDPLATTDKTMLQRMLSFIMYHSSLLQTRWLSEERRRTHQQHCTEQRQVMEVIKFIQENDSMHMWQTGPLKECFGTLGTNLVMPEQSEMNKENNGQENNGQENNGQNMQDETETVFSTFEELLANKMQPGDCLAVTFGSHTICMQKHPTNEYGWYVFDSLSGQLVYVQPETTADILEFCNIRKKTVDLGSNNEDLMFSGVICCPPPLSSLPSYSSHSSLPSAHSALSSSR